MSQFVYDLVTSHIVNALSKGVIPWRKPWNEAASLPINAVSKRPYRGVNLFLLGLQEYEDPRWVTFKQAQELGGHVRQGEKSSVAVFYKRHEFEDAETGNRKTVPLLRFYHVFNVGQAEGLKLPALERRSVSATERIGEAEFIANSMPNAPDFVKSLNGAWYSPLEDKIGMPRLASFESSDHYYSVLFHEIAHSTGHPTRLNRFGTGEPVQFGSETYGHEELVAELASAFVCASIGLDNSLIDNSASYIQGWLGALKHNKRSVLTASAQAQKAADYIRGITVEVKHEQP